MLIGVGALCFSHVDVSALGAVCVVIVSVDTLEGRALTVMVGWPFWVLSNGLRVPRCEGG